MDREELQNQLVERILEDMGTDELVAMAGDWLDEQYDKLTDEEIIFQAGDLTSRGRDSKNYPCPFFYSALNLCSTEDRPKIG